MKKAKIDMNHPERITSPRFAYLKNEAEHLTDMKMTLKVIDGQPYAQIGTLQTNRWSAALRYVREQAETIVNNEVRS